MNKPTKPSSPSSKSKHSVEVGVPLRGAEKVARIPIKVEPSTEVKRKPKWIRAKAPTSPEAQRVKRLLREFVKKLPAQTWGNASATAQRLS